MARPWNRFRATWHKIVYVVHGSRVIRCASNRVERKGSSKEDRREQVDEDSVVSEGERQKLVKEKNELNVQTDNLVNEESEKNQHKDKYVLPREKRLTRKPERYTDTWTKEEPPIEEVNTVIIPPERYNDPDVFQAKESELRNWFEMEAVDVIEDKGQKLITTRWVISQKELEGGISIAKARLVIRGFEEEEQHQADAPTAAKLTLRIVLTIAANEDWNIETIDIKAAFLQGRPIDRDVFVLPPEEAREEGFIWRLRKTAYGLIDAARSWFMSVKDELLKAECKQSQLDKAVFRWYHEDKLQGIVLLHVDDFFMTGTTNFRTAVSDRITTKFKIRTRKVRHFEYVGLHIKKNAHGIEVNQNQYVHELKDDDLKSSIKVTGDLSKYETRLLRSIIGQIHWVSSQTRPDLCFDILDLSVERNKATGATLKKQRKHSRNRRQVIPLLTFAELETT